MYFANVRLNPVEGARAVLAACSNCSNKVEFRLHYAKEGLGLSVPIAPLFTDKLTWARKTFYLVCPICSAMDKISRENARKLGVI